MMGRDQFLLNLLMEECAEVQQEASKCNRFGLDEQMNSDTPPNKQRLINEVNDFYAILCLLEREFGIDFIPNEDKIKSKLEKIERYYQYSKSLGRVK